MKSEKSQRDNLCALASFDYVALSGSETVSGAIEDLRRQGKSLKDRSTYLYVTDDAGKLVGIVAMPDLLTTDPRTPLSEVMNPRVVSLQVGDSVETARQRFVGSSFFVIPLVENDGRLIGVLNRDRILPASEAKKSSGLRQWVPFGSEEVEGKRVGEIILRRLPWLLISLTMGLMCAFLLGLFIGKAELIVALILFVPIILGLSGSIGTQSGVVVARDLKEGKLSIAKVGAVLLKDLGIGAGLGAVCSAVVLLISLLWKRGFILSLAFGLSISACIFVSGCAGVVLAFIFHLLRVKPGFSSNLLRLLICDMLALILYFLIALTIVNPVLDIG